MKTHALLMAGVLALGACATTPTVNFDSDPAANFVSYHSYSWAFRAAPNGMNPLLFERVKASIDRTLAARGYTQSDTGDFAVAFTLGRRDRVEVDDFGAYGPYYARWGGWGGYRNVDVRNVTDGTLVIDVYDTASKKPVWHGTATQEVTSAKVDDAKIDAAVAAVLANFPPPAGK